MDHILSSKRRRLEIMNAKNAKGRKKAYKVLIKMTEKATRDGFGEAIAKIGKDKKIVVLDEPFDGFDPVQLIEILELIRLKHH